MESEKAKSNGVYAGRAELSAGGIWEVRENVDITFKANGVVCQAGPAVIRRRERR